MSFDWKGTIGSITPWIAGTLGGPAAGFAVKALCAATGMEPSLENAQKAAEQAAAGKLTGDQFLALKQAEAEIQLKMQEMGYKSVTDLEEIAFKDRDSARAREIQVHDKTPAILAYAITVGFFVVLGFILWRGLPDSEAGKNVTLVLVGALGSAWSSGVIGYYFGTSASSRSKDQMLYNSTPTSGGKG